jgi:hypothetical protein
MTWRSPSKPDEDVDLIAEAAASLNGPKRISRSWLIIAILSETLPFVHAYLFRCHENNFSWLLMRVLLHSEVRFRKMPESSSHLCLGRKSFPT